MNEKMDAIGIIPARYASTRFPGKLFQDLAGKTILEWVYERARQAKSLRRVYIAPDLEAAEKIMQLDLDLPCVPVTMPCRSGSDRVWQAFVLLGQPSKIIVNIQGDDPLVDPRAIDDCVEGMTGKCCLVTPIRPMSEADKSDPNRVKVVVAEDLALYFSRLPVPHGGPWYEHLGIYAYRANTLACFSDSIHSLRRNGLEDSERLEQLRALEMGIPIFVTAGDYTGHAIDTPESLERLRLDMAQKLAAPAPAPSGTVSGNPGESDP